MNVTPTAEEKRLAEFAIGIYKTSEGGWCEYTTFSEGPINSVEDIRIAANKWVDERIKGWPALYDNKFREKVLKELLLVEYVVVFDGYAMSLMSGYLDGDDWYDILNFRHDREEGDEYKATLREAAEDLGAEFYQLYRREFKVEG